MNVAKSDRWKENAEKVAHIIRDPKKKKKRRDISSFSGSKSTEREDKTNYFSAEHR